MKRRLFSLFLALTLVVGMLPAPAFAQETEPTQVTEAPTEAPATEAPATEVPATEEPATEAPAAEPTPAPTEAPVPETTAAPAPTEAPAEPAPTEDEAVAAVQAMIDALPDVDDMSESYIDALEAAYSAYEALSAAQQAKITGAERLEALFDWVNGQVSTLADYVEEIKNSEGWTNRGTITWPVRLTGNTWLTLTGTNRIECDQPLDLNGYNLIIQGTGTLELVGKGGSSYKIGATLCDSTWTGTSSGGTLTIQGGTVKVSGSDQNAVCVKTLHMTGGSLEARGGKNAGIVCSALETNTTSGSLYATGEDYGISMYSPYYYGDAVNQMSILISSVRDAEPADMDVGDVDAIKDSEQKSVYMGEVTGPLFSVKAQKGYLYEGIAAQTATFAISAKNVDTSTLKTQWAGDHTGLTESLSADSKTLTVTTDAAVKQGTYDLTITDGSAVTKTVTVTVLGAPITVTTQPQDTYGRTLDGETWQGDNLATEVRGTLADGLTGNITYQWKLKDGTVLDGFTEPTLKLADLSAAGKLTRQTDKTWLSSAKVYCTLTVGSYSVDTDTVTMTASDCNYQRVNHVDGSCLQCGEFHSQNPLLVAEDGYFAVVPDEPAEGAAKVGGNLVVGGTFYLTKDLRSRGLNAGNTTKDNKDTILDLQGHTLAWLQMDNFPYGTFTLKNGTLNQPVSSNAGGVLILDGVTFGSGCFQATNYSRLEITVKGNTLFRETVSFNNDYRDIHLQGGTFEKGISARDGEQALAFLDDGFAYQDSQGNIVDASYAGNIDGIKIQVVEHKCDYVGGKCACGRVCVHAALDENGYCTVCKSLVELYAIGQTRYKSLEAALTAAKDGDTITLRGDFYQGAITVEINKSVTLDLGGHTLTGNAEDSVLLVLAENVIIQNGTVENTYTAKSSPAVTVSDLNAVGGLTTKNVTFTGSTNGVTPQSSGLIIRPGGKAKVESGTFNGGIYVDTDGSLIMCGGSATELVFEMRYDTIQLSGGSFGYLPNPWQDYKRLLAEGYAYQSSDGKLVKLADMSSYAAEQVVKCTHPDGLTADTVCPYCGKKCGHENTSKETGLCPDCGYQAYTAKIGDTLYATAEEALEKAEDNQTVTLLADDTLPDNYVLDLDKAITLNMNSKKLTGNAMTVAGELTVPSGGRLDVPMEITGKLTLNGPAATLLQDVSVRASGTLILDRTTAAAAGTISVYENGSFELRDGAVGKLVVEGGKAILSSGRIMKSVTVKSGNLSSILAEGKALVRREDGTVIDGTGSAATGILDIQDHTHTFGQGGKCACGATAPVQVEAGTDSFYYDDFEEAVKKAQSLSGSTLRLLEDVTYSGTSYISIDSGTFTIDWNGRTLSGGNWLALLSLDKASNVTLKDSSGTNTGGARNTASLGGPAVRFVLGTGGSAAIEGGTYSPQVMVSKGYYGPVRISGGVFENDVKSGKNGALYNENGTLNGLLAEGTAFVYDANDSEKLNAYEVALSAGGKTVYAVAHTHKNWEDGKCAACGYPCPHEHWTNGVCDLCGGVCAHARYENGKCTTCGYLCPHENVEENDGVYTCGTCGMTMTVMVETGDGGSCTTDLAAALSGAEDGTIVTLLDDVPLAKNADITDGKKVTLDMNGHNINQGGKTLNVEGKGSNLIITGSGNLSFSVNAKAGGQLDMTDWTGTVVNVNPSGICDFVGPTGNGHIDNLNIGNWRNGNVGTITLQGGSIGKLWLNSFEDFEITLGSLLKSGYAAKNDSGYLRYDHAIKYVYQGQRENILYNLTIELCPHTGLDENGRCTYCNKTGFVAMVTKNGVSTGYTDFNSALREVCNGKSGTLKLLKNASLNSSYQYVISGTLDLNGKDLSGQLVCVGGSNLQIVNSGSDMSNMDDLFVNGGAKVTIADTTGSIVFRMVNVENGSVAELLPEGGAYKAWGTWVSAEEAANSTILDWVQVYTAPVKSLTLTANQTTVAYGKSQTVTLTASRTLIPEVSARYAWAEVLSDGTVQTFPEEVDASFTLPEGVNAGVHTYRVSVTADGYTRSETIEITVTKIAGTLTNKDYPTEFTYGDTVPTPEAENFTFNNPDGTFRCYWEVEGDAGLPEGENPTDAGTYVLHVTRTAGTNHTEARLALTVTVKKAPQTADITVVNETISGKGDGGVTLKPAVENYEFRKKGETNFVTAFNAAMMNGRTFRRLEAGVTYEIRLAETDNYLASDIQEVTVQPGRKLTVTLPENQKGYTLTASKTELDWHENVVLTFKLNPVGAYKTDDFCIWKEENKSKVGIALDVITLSNVSNDITITVTGVALDDRAPTASIQGRQLTENRRAYVKWDGFADDPVDDYVNGDFVITASDRGSGVASVWYCLSDKPLTLADMTTASWMSAPLTGTSQAKVPITEDGAYYLYVKVLDKANNPGYACTGKLVKESNPPTFSGVKDGETYYVSRQLEIHDDGMPDWYMEVGGIGKVPNGTNKNPIQQKIDGNRDATYTIQAADRCGNEATITVYMKPISDLTKPIDDILDTNIRKSDRANLDAVEAALKGLDTTYATAQELAEIHNALARIGDLQAVLRRVAEVEAQIDALPDSVEPYQQTVEETQIKPARNAYNGLSDHQKTLVDGTKLAKLERLETQLNTWTITKGDGQVWNRGSGKSLSFTVNGQTRKIMEIVLDSNPWILPYDSIATVSGEVDAPEVTVSLTALFLQERMDGEHTFRILYYDGETENVTFTIKTPANYLDVTGRTEFDTKTTVTIDGVEYPIEQLGGERYVNLPETGDLMTIYSFQDGTPTGSYTNYPTGMQVYKITRQEGGAKTEEITEFANLLNYAGCSIRVSGKKGIRMITAIDQNVKKSLVSKAGIAGYTLEEYGTVVQWADTLGSDTLNLGSGKSNFAYKKGNADPIFAKADGMIQYTNVLVGFTDAQCQPNLVMRPYIKLKDTATGETVTLYGGCVTRSIGYVAWQNRDTYKPGTASYKYVWSIIDNVDTTGYPE